MITGAHSIIYSTDAEADRAFLQNVLKLPHVDVGQGWLIFGLPPAEIAVHPSEANDRHEFYFMVDDVQAFVADMEKHHIACAPISDQGWGLLTSVALPGGGRLGMYQPRHARPKSPTVGKAMTSAKRRPRAKRAVTKPAKSHRKSGSQRATKTSRRR